MSGLSWGSVLVSFLLTMPVHTSPALGQVTLNGSGRFGINFEGAPEPESDGAPILGEKQEFSEVSPTACPKASIETGARAVLLLKIIVKEETGWRFANIGAVEDAIGIQDCGDFIVLSTLFPVNLFRSLSPRVLIGRDSYLRYVNPSTEKQIFHFPDTPLREKLDYLFLSGN